VLSYSRETYFHSIHTRGMAHSSTPSERPEARGDSARICIGHVSSFCAASKVATAAFVRIWRLVHPCEFGADLLDRGLCARHRLSLCHLSNYASQCAHSTVGECLAETAWRHILCSQETRLAFGVSLLSGLMFPSRDSFFYGLD